MNRLRAHYLLVYAVEGALLPFLSVYLARERGLGTAEIGLVLGVASAATLISPGLLTALADRAVPPRRLLIAALLASAAALALLRTAGGLAATLGAVAAFSIAFEPVKSLQDGLFFVEQQRRLRHAQPVVGFQTVRVWGTAGYLLPSLLLFFLLRNGGTTGITIVAAGATCAVAAAQARSLPAGRGERLPPTRAGNWREGALSEAVRRLTRRDLWPTALGLVLLNMGTAAYAAFYPLYLTDAVGLADEWLGMVATIGVAIEILYMLGFSRLVRRFGLRRVMVVGACSQVLRLALLAGSSSLAVAIGTQALHGFGVLVVQVAGKVHLDQRAADGYRNSMQGLYTMLSRGGGRVVGSILAGQAGRAGLAWVFAGASAVSLVAALLLMSRPDEDAASPT